MSSSYMSTLSQIQNQVEVQVEVRSGPDQTAVQSPLSTREELLVNQEQKKPSFGL